LILREIVGLVPEIFAESRYFVSRLILNDHSITGWPRIATRTAVAVRNQIVLGRILTGFKQVLGARAAG